MRNRKRFTGALVLLLGLLIFVGGCDKEIVKETENPGEHLTESEIHTEPETQTETEIETNVEYTAQDKSVRITLPDSTWKVTQDVDEMRVFSGGTAMINIVHAADESQMKRNISSVAKTQEELERNLSNQYPGENAFKIESFEGLSAGTLNTYEYVVSYNSTSMWAYAVTYGIIAEDQAYVVTGTVTDDNRPLLDTVIKSVESFTVLNNPAFGGLTQQPVQNQTGVERNSQSESQDQTGSSSTAEEELQSLTEYGTSAQLYAADEVNVRAEPSKESNENIIYSLNKGDAVTVVGETSQWFKVNINGMIGYVSKEFLVSSPVNTGSENSGSADSSDNTGSPSGSDDQSGNEDQEQGGSSGVDDAQQAEYNSTVDYDSSYTYYTTTDVNMRSGPSTNADKVGGLGGGTAVTVVGETPNWFIVSVNGSRAYISKSYISTTDPGYSSSGSTGGDSSGGSTGGDSSGGSSAGGDYSGGGSTGGDSSGGSAGGDSSGGGSAGGDSSGGGSAGGDSSGGASGTVSGTITSAGVNVIVVAGDDGNTYTVNTGDASVSAADGIYSGLYVSVGYDSSSSDGSLHATSVTGY